MSNHRSLAVLFAATLSLSACSSKKLPAEPQAGFLRDYSVLKEGQIFLGREIAQHQDYSEDTALKIDHEVKRFVTDNYQRSHVILTQAKATLTRIADELLAREVLDADQVKRIAAGLPLDDPQPAARPPLAEEDEARPRSKERAPIVPALNKPLPQE